MTKSNCKLPKPSVRRALRAKALNSCSCVLKVFETRDRIPRVTRFGGLTPVHHQIRSRDRKKRTSIVREKPREIEALLARELDFPRVYFE